MDLLASNIDWYPNCYHMFIWWVDSHIHNINHLIQTISMAFSMGISRWEQPREPLPRTSSLLKTPLDVGQGLVHFVSQTWPRFEPTENRCDAKDPPKIWSEALNKPAGGRKCVFLFLGRIRWASFTTVLSSAFPSLHLHDLKHPQFIHGQSASNCHISKTQTPKLSQTQSVRSPTSPPSPTVLFPAKAQFRTSSKRVLSCLFREVQRNMSRLIATPCSRVRPKQNLGDVLRNGMGPSRVCQHGPVTL